MEIDGEYNTADVKIDNLEEACEEQIQEMVNGKGLEGDADVSIMPDTHLGKGAVIGFTMPLKSKIIPNVVSVDIGCGMYAANFGRLEFDSLEKLDEEVRSRIPTGFDVHCRNDYHML